MDLTISNFTDHFDDPPHITENVPLYFQVPLGVELHKLNLTSIPSQAILTLKGKLFRKRKLIGATSFKLTDSASKQITYASTLEFLVNIPIDKQKNRILKGPVTSSTVFEPTCCDSQQDTNDDSDDEYAAMSNNSNGKFLHIVVSKKFNTASKPAFVNDCLLDLTHYCSLQQEWQGRVSIPVEITKDVTANINLQIFSVVGNQLSSNGRRSGSLDVQRGKANSSSTTPPLKRIDSLNDKTDTSPQQQIPKVATNSTSSTPVSVSTPTSTSTTAVVQMSTPTTVSSPQISPQNIIKEMNLLQFESSTSSPSSTNSNVNNNNNNGQTTVNSTMNSNMGNVNNSSNGLSNQSSMSDFFKKRAEVNNGRSRSDSSPGLQLTNFDNNNGTPNSTFSPTSAYQVDNSPSESPSVETIKQENAHLKSVLQRAKTRFQEVVTENAQLKERIKQLEAQVLSLQLSQNSNSIQIPKTAQDFFDPFQ